MSFGIDLGGTAAFSACAAFWPRTGRLEGFVACGTRPELSERALADGVAGVYEAMRDAGELVQIGGRSFLWAVPAGSAEAIRAAGRDRGGPVESGGAGGRRSRRRASVAGTHLAWARLARWFG